MSIGCFIAKSFYSSELVLSDVTNNLLINPDQEKDAQSHTDNFRDRKRPPDQMDIAAKR